MYAIINGELYLVHHGIKGQKWGVRRFQYADGTYTPAGERRYYVGKGKIDSYKDVIKNKATMTTKELSNYTKAYVLGKNTVDSYLKQGTTFSRIQSDNNTVEFGKYAFYATYKKHDINEYAGLFGKNLKDRAKHAAEQQVKEAKKTGKGMEEALAAKKNADNMQIYQLHIKNTKKLKIPSDESAGRITKDLLSDKEFKKNLEASIDDSKSKMLRPQQQILFNDAKQILKRDPKTISTSESSRLYRALNLTLTNHNVQEQAMQNTFYSALKKNGYGALVDTNDKEYSSYHSKRPIIIFDTDSVKLQAVSKVDPKKIQKYYNRYNAERIIKEIPASTLGTLRDYGKTKYSQAADYVNRKTNDYLHR